MTAMKKSHARIAFAWLFGNVDPALLAPWLPNWRLRHVLPHRPRRNSNAQFHQQFTGNPLFTPKRILLRHPADQCAQLDGNPRSARSTFPAPEQAPAKSVPSDDGFRLYYYQCIPPIEEPSQDRQADSRSGIRPSWFYAALFEQAQLPPKEAILRLHRSRQPELKDDIPRAIGDQLDNDLDKRDHVTIMP